MASIRKDLPADEALRHHMRKALKAIAADLAAARDGAGAHAARRRLKLCRSLLRLMEPALGNVVFLREDTCLRDAARALAGLRRHEAMLEAVAKLASPKHPERRETLDELTAALRAMQERNGGARDVGDRVDAAAKHIEAMRSRLIHWRLPKHGIRLFVDGMKASYARARKKLRGGLDGGPRSLLHEARKSIIHHYHHLDLLKNVWPKLLEVWMGELQDLRGALGDINDLDELEALLESREIVLSNKRVGHAARKLIAARRQVLIARVSKETGHLFAESPNSFAARMSALWEQWRA
jgi:CHAD domain-containing protein